ncbi:putative feruloyl esterase C [Madurella mycetomatis]|uniref:Feruloyl esterase C n=1 Tax=Madurella mycetomatis TaxID=100816 RepID=A0A175W007_9PEZI|nr:putative feruloyl esterase C [Madurella mycetomatis]
MVSSKTLVILLFSFGSQVALGQQAVWAQCGGQGWTGGTTCVSGACCSIQNQWYSQCLPGNCNPSSGGSPVPTTPSPSSGETKSPGCGKNPLASGTRSVNVNGKNRQYIIRVPNGYDRNKAYKLIFGFHWRGGSMNDVASGGTDREAWAYYGMQRVGQESAILVAPNGLNGGWGNAGGEDIAFVDAMIADIETGLCIDQRQRYAIGFSWGGAMSYSIACSRAKVFRGVAVISGGVLSGCSGGSDPIAYIGIHGVTDNVLGISGGRAMRDKFVANNGCTMISPQEPAVGSKGHVKTEYTDCNSGYPVTWIAFDGGHYPGAVDGQGESGAKSYVPGEIFSFFSMLT